MDGLFLHELLLIL